MTRSTLHRVLATAALVPVLALGACGGSDKGSTATSTKDSTATTAAGASSSAAESGDSVAIKGFAFNPPNLKVKVGTKVTWTNKDDFAHTVSAKDKSFDSGNLDTGATFEQTFDKAGTYDYICDIHNSMMGTVTVS